MCQIELGAGEERAVPATKTFTAQLAAVALVAEALGPVPWTRRRLGAAAGAMIEELLADAGPADARRGGARATPTS